MPALDPLIARLYRATADVPAARFRAWALEAIRSELPFDGAAWGTGHLASLRFHTRTCLQVDEGLFDDLLTYRDINPLGHYFSANTLQPGQAIPQQVADRLGKAVAMTDLQDDAEFYGSDIYRLCFQPRRIARILSSLHLHQRSGIFTLLSLYRFDRDHPFTEAEKAIQQQLLFHLLESERHAFYLRLQAARPEAGECFALVDSAGHYYQVDPDFLDLLDAQHSGDTRLPFPPAQAPEKLGGLALRTEREGELWVVGIRPEHPLDQLTEREWQVVAGVRSGKTFKTIGRELGLSPSTVANHLYRIYRKLGVDNRNGLLALCQQNSC